MRNKEIISTILNIVIIIFFIAGTAKLIHQIGASERTIKALEESNYLMRLTIDIMDKSK